MTQDKPWSEWVGVDRLMVLHSAALARDGGAGGPADPSSCLDGALGAAYSAELYFEGRKHARPGLVFAAYLLFYLVQRHCYIDGNKRVAWMSALDVLQCLGLDIEASDDEGFAMIEDVIAHRIESGDGVAAWMAPRLLAL